MSAISQADMDRFTIQDWKHEVANGDTVLGYLDWVEHRIDAAGRDCPHCSSHMEELEREDDGQLSHESGPDGCPDDCPACLALVHWQCTNPECPGNKDALGSEANVEAHFNKL
jgi:transposase